MSKQSVLLLVIIIVCNCWALDLEELKKWREKVQDIKYQCPESKYNTQKDILSILEVVNCDEQGAIFRYDYKVIDIYNIDW